MKVRLLLATALLHPTPAFAAAPMWQQAPGQPPPGVLLTTPGIAPFEAPERPASIFVGMPVDLMGDSRPELVFCHGTNAPSTPQAQPCRVLETFADGSVIDRSFQLFGASLPMTTASREIEAADFNGDGRADLFISTQGYDGPPFPGERNVLLVSRSDGTFENRSSQLPSQPDFTHSVSAGDVDHDDDLDLVVGNLGNPQNQFVYLLMNDGTGNFTVDTSRLPAAVVGMTEAYTTMQFADFDADGYAELFVGCAGGIWTTSSVLRNDGTGQLDTLPRVDLPPGPFGTANEVLLDSAVLDLNADGRLDLLVLSTRTDYNGMAMQALVNDGSGGFVDQTMTRFGDEARRTTGRYYSRIRLSDLNADGATDFHFGDGPDDYPRYWINDGQGRFSALPTNALGRYTDFGVHSLDFDGDGRPDQLQLEHYSEGRLLYASFMNRTPVTPLFADGFE